MKTDHFTIDDKNSVRFLSNDLAIDRLTELIRSGLTKYFDEVTDNLKVKGRLWGGQETARTFKFDLLSANTIKHVIFVKICPKFEKLNPAMLEYETLKLLYDKIPMVQKNCRVSRPLDYYPELNAYAMESVGTKCFKSYLLKNNSRLKNDDSLTELFSYIAGCAKWLSAFHSITKSDNCFTFNTDTFIKSIIHESPGKPLQHFSFKKQTLDKLESLFENLHYYNKFQLPCAKWHWDYTPGHVFIDNDKISVIDILGLDNTPIYEDIGRFLATISTINNLPFYPLFDHKRASGRLCDIFTNDYLSNTNNEKPPLPHSDKRGIVGFSVEKEQFIFFTNVYKLKYLIIWFLGQHQRVSSKIHPIVGNIFANIRLVKLFEKTIVQTMEEILRSQKALP